MYRSVFLSHSSADQPFARRLVEDLRSSGFTVWFDETAIGLGDSLIGKIAVGLAESDCVIGVLSPEAASSPWVRKELEIAVTREVQGRAMNVIPLLYRDCDIPVFLLDKRYADFRDSNRYAENLAQLLKALGAPDTATPADVAAYDTSYRIQAALVSAEMLLRHVMHNAAERDLERIRALVTRARILATQATIAPLITSRQPEPHFTSVDVTRLIHDLVSSFRAFAEGHHLSIDVARVPASVIVQSDRTLLEVVVYQLLDNAVKYSYAGTSIVIDVRRMRSSIRIAVTNRGMKIEQHEMKYVFERGYRGSSAAAVTSMGAGIGLYHANQAALAVRGRLSLQSAPTSDVITFTLDLPVSADRPAQD